jgi:ActR/RegA family two-component response regulator
MKTDDRRILIIDDERPILLTLEALLARRGYQVDTAPTASQGLNLLKSKSPASFCSISNYPTQKD